MNSSPAGVAPAAASATANAAPESTMSSYMIVAFVIIFLIFSSIIYYMKDVFYSIWRSAYPVSELTGQPIVSEQNTGTVSDTQPASTVLDYAGMTTSTPPGPVDTTVAVAAAAASSDQTWCLVGEDMAGRWCMQVQSDAHCDADRTYRTKNKCESGGSS